MGMTRTWQGNPGQGTALFKCDLCGKTRVCENENGASVLIPKGWDAVEHHDIQRILCSEKCRVKFAEVMRLAFSCINKAKTSGTHDLMLSVMAEMGG